MYFSIPISQYSPAFPHSIYTAITLTSHEYLPQAEGKTSTFSFSGMKTKLFGSDTPEQREQKIKMLDEQIVESEAQVKQATEEAQ